MTKLGAMLEIRQHARDVSKGLDSNQSTRPIGALFQSFLFTRWADRLSDMYLTAVLGPTRRRPAIRSLMLGTFKRKS